MVPINIFRDETVSVETLALLKAIHGTQECCFNSVVHGRIAAGEEGWNISANCPLGFGYRPTIVHQELPRCPLGFVYRPTIVHQELPCSHGTINSGIW